MNRKVESGRPIQNLVVARYRDGRMIKGVTYNFSPQKRFFHVIPLTDDRGEEIRKGIEVVLSELKAIFFVKSLEGRKGFSSFENLLEEEEQTNALKIRVVFHDGETLLGLTHGYSREKEGFFVIPLEKESNNLRVFVVFDSVREIEVLK